MILVILNLGAPLDYHLILGAGMFTAVYILSRALGKYFGAYFGAAVTKSPQTVKNILVLHCSHILEFLLYLRELRFPF